MGIEVKKQERENTQSLTRRFTKKIQRSGVLVYARKSRFRKRTKSKQMERRAALRKEKLRKEYEKTEKLGLTKK